MKWSTPLVAAAFLLALGLYGCSDITSPHESDATPASEGLECRAKRAVPEGSVVVPLVVGWRRHIGTVTLSNDATELCMEISTEDGWPLQAAQAAYGASFRDLPRRGRWGRLDPSCFPLQEEFDPPSTTATFTFDWQAAGFEVGDVVVLAVHGDAVHENQTGWLPRARSAWAKRRAFPRMFSARFFRYMIQEVEESTEPCAVQVTAPNGDDELCMNESFEITWDITGECTGFVKIELYQAGYLCQVLAWEAPNTGTFLWEGIGVCEGGWEDYAVRITDIESGAWDESDASFSIEMCDEEEW